VHVPLASLLPSSLPPGIRHPGMSAIQYYICREGMATWEPWWVAPLPEAVFDWESASWSRGCLGMQPGVALGRDRPSPDDGVPRLPDVSTRRTTSATSGRMKWPTFMKASWTLHFGRDSMEQQALALTTIHLRCCAERHRSVLVAAIAPAWDRLHPCNPVSHSNSYSTQAQTGLSFISPKSFFPFTLL